jgi:acetyltransferase-like isoleucine patch superfamily enzyme
MFKRIRHKLANFKRFLIIRSIYPKGVIIEGDYKRIKIGENTIIEPGVVLSTQYKGKIIIGANCEIRRGTIISTHGGDIKVGDNCSFNPYCVVYGTGGLNIGHHVRIATHTSIIPSNHKYKDRNELIINQGLTKIGIMIRNDIWIGAGVIILDGTEINDGVVVAAGAVVKGNIKKNIIVGGIPAKKISER